MSEHVAQQLIGRIWTTMSEGKPFEECRTAEMAINVAGPEVWELVDQHFAERAAHPTDERGGTS